MSSNVDSLRDRSKDGYPLEKLERMIRDCENQPAWRDRADQACAYTDGRQMTAEQEAQYIEDGLEPRIVNLVGRVINSVLGTQAKARRDTKIEADEDAFVDVAEVISVRHKEAKRETGADMAISNAYASQVKAGLGWVEVSRTRDPLDYPYRVTDVHRSEMWWDWRAKALDLSDARWVTRRRWMDLDEVTAQMPEFADVFEQMVDNWAGVIADDWGDERWKSAYDSDRRFGVARTEWIDGGRRRVKLYEVWYRVWVETVVFRVPGGQWRKLDTKNPRHVEAVGRGLVEITKANTAQMRMALFAGPIRLVDVETDRRRFPYIPFFAFRTDQDNTPYGLVEGMIPAQDEYNERRMRIQWMLKAQQLLIDNDAVDIKYNTIQDIAKTMTRPDMVAILNSNRKNTQGLVMRNDMTLQKEQYDVMQDAKQLIQDIPGVYSTQMGNAPAGVTSGLAINSLVEQGIVAMGELNDNFSFAERLVNEALMDLIVEDLKAPNLQVMIGAGQTRRPIVLNTQDDQGRPVNMVADAPIKVGMSEVPSSPAYRMQIAQQLSQVIGALQGNPQAVAVLTPAFIEATGLPDRQVLADDLRRVSGLPTAGDRQGAQQMQQAQQAQQAQTAQVAQQMVQLEGQHKQALAEKDAAQARLTNAKAAEAEVAVHQAAQAPQPAGHNTLINDALAEAMAG